MRFHSWDMPPDEFRRTMRELTMKYHKWDLHVGGRCRILPETLVLTREEHETIVSAVEALTAGLRAFEEGVRRDERALEFLGVSPELRSLIANEPPTPAGFGRCDFFLTPSGRWMISEFNEDVPGGFNEAVGLERLLPREAAGGEFPADLARALVSEFEGCRAVGLVYATGFSEDMQHMVVVQDWLGEAGIEGVLGSPEHLQCSFTGRVRLSGRRIDGALRFYPGEWMKLVPNIRHWRRAMKRLRMVNPLVRLASQSKLSFAKWGEMGGLGDGLARLVAEHIPHTEAFDPARKDAYSAERERWVLKGAFGRMGDTVVIGSLASPVDWDRCLAEAEKAGGPFAMQERFEVRKLQSASGELYPTVGAYVVGGRFAGYYSRAAAAPFISSEAYHVPTAVEAA